MNISAKLFRFVFWIVLFGCPIAAGASDTNAVPGNVPCMKNFSVHGAPASPSGTVYTTEATIDGISKADAVKRAANKVTSDGLVVVTADAGAGLVVASNKVANGVGEASTLEIKITEAGPGHLNVGLRFPLRTGLVASDNNIRNHMCEVVAAIHQ